ncbi:MAG: RNA-binding S4 domain-containing protein [Clostridia bacterium]|nr:RNA-binding S4 domain-containing protein [Clostridia bacterium]
MTNNIKINTPYIELDSFLKFANICMSGGEAKMLIQGGEVLVNGAVCTQRKKKLYVGDEISVDGQSFTVQG